MHGEVLKNGTSLMKFTKNPNIEHTGACTANLDYTEEYRIVIIQQNIKFADSLTFHKEMEGRIFYSHTFRKTALL